MSARQFVVYTLLNLSVLIRLTRADPPEVETLPSCAAQCALSASQTDICSPSDQECTCTNHRFHEYVTECVMDSCTVPEALLAENISSSRCGKPLRDRSDQLVITSSLLAILAGVFVITRFVTKLWIVRLQLWLDDWLILIAMISMTPSAFINVFGLASHGLGRDIWTLEPREITKVLMYFHIMAWLYFLDTTLIKLSMVSFYLRLFPTQGTRRLLWATFALTGTWGTSFVLVAIFQCRPLQHFWRQWDGTHEGSCLNANTIAWSNAATNIALDLWILLIPLWKLGSLQMHWKKKVGVGFMFIIGTFVTIISILRLQSLIVFAKSSNSTWDFYNVCLWSTIEVTVGVMCTCLPTVRQLLIKAFPRLGESFGTKSASRGDRPNQGMNGSRAGNIPMTITTVAATKKEGHPDGGNPSQGILVQNTYSVIETNEGFPGA